MPQSQKIWRPAIEYVVVEHCNLKCLHCDHVSNSLPAKVIAVEQFQRDLNVLSGVLRVGELRILGGEPLLHPRIVELLEIARSSGIAEEIVLITNGLLLNRVSEAAWQLIDGIWISLYPGITYNFDLRELREKANRYDVWIWQKQTDEFLKLHLQAENTNEALVRHIYRKCIMAHFHSCHVIYEGRYFKCPPSVFLEQRLRLDGVAVSNKAVDSVAIHESEALAEDLRDYIEARTPLRACSYCLGSSARMVPHSLGTRTEFSPADFSPSAALRDDVILPHSIRGGK